LEPLDHQLVGAGIIGQALLREYAHLEVDRPFVFIDQRGDSLEPAHADAGIDLDLGAHARCAVLDAFFQRPRCARVDVLDRPRLLHRRDAFYRIDLARLLGRATLDDARFVEMDVRFDQPGARDPAGGVVFLSFGCEFGGDRGDASVFDADIDGPVFRPGAQARVADDEVHAMLSLIFIWSRDRARCDSARPPPYPDRSRARGRSAP